MEGLERISDAYEDKDIIASMIYYKNPVHDDTPDDTVIFQQTFNEAFIPPNIDEENANREVTVKNSERILKSILFLFTIGVIICIIVYYLVLY